MTETTSSTYERVLLISAFQCKHYKKIFSKVHSRKCSLICENADGEKSFKILIEKPSKNKFYKMNIDQHKLKVKIVKRNAPNDFAFVVKSNGIKIVFITNNLNTQQTWMSILTNLEETMTKSTKNISDVMEYVSSETISSGDYYKSGNLYKKNDSYSEIENIKRNSNSILSILSD